MDSSYDVMRCTLACTRGAGSGYITVPAQRRASRSMENRSPSDAGLRLYPGYETDYATFRGNNSCVFQSSTSSMLIDGEDRLDSEIRALGEKYKYQIARAQDRIIAELKPRDQRESAQVHILMLAI